MRTSALFGAKTFEFFEIFGVFARTRGLRVTSTDILGTRGEVNFSRFCAHVLYGQPLTSIHYLLI